MKTTIETATPYEIAQYLKHLEDIAWDKASEDTVDGERRNSAVWKQLYETIFSKEISRKIMDRFPNFSWYDPDEDYYDDVTSFIRDFVEYSEQHTNEDGTPLFPSFGDWKEKQDEIEN